MQKARLVKANEMQPAKAEAVRAKGTQAGQLERAVTEWVSERRSEWQNARQAFAALFAFDGIMR